VRWWVSWLGRHMPRFAQHAREAAAAGSMHRRHVQGGVPGTRRGGLAWPGWATAVKVAIPCEAAAVTAALPRGAGMATGDIRVTMTGEAAGTAATATPTPGMEAVVAIADATRSTEGRPQVAGQSGLVRKTRAQPPQLPAQQGNNGLQKRGGGLQADREQPSLITSTSPRPCAGCCRAGATACPASSRSKLCTRSKRRPSG
jgi:hypothetical protein